MTHHHHDHSHHHHSSSQDKKMLLTSFKIITLFMVVEFVVGDLVNSLALMADARHMANDSFSLGLALVGLSIAATRPKLSKWLAIINGGSLIFIALYIIWEAIERIQSPMEMAVLPMVAVAALGLLVNLFVARLMFNANQENLNIRSAYLHVLADLMGSVVAIISGLSAYCFSWLWVDPVASLLLSPIILRSGLTITKAAIRSLSA